MAEAAPSPASSLAVVVSSVVAGVGITWFAGGNGPTVGAIPLLVIVALVSFGIQWVAFVPAYLTRSEKFYDLTGSLTYALLVIAAASLSASRGELDWRGAFATGAVLLWAGRLGSFLALRVHRAGKDGRFDAIKTSWHRFLVAWTVQGLWVVLTALAAFVTITRPVPRPLGVVDLLGVSAWAVGFAMEVVADRQKARFSSDPSRRGQFIRSGLWAWSRHPNYAGEILLWTGIFLLSSGGLEGARWLAFLSPVFVWGLLRFVSGIPILERRADERWGGQPDYERYKADTPVLWPRPPRR